MPITHIQNIKINYIKSGNGEPFILLHGIYSDSSSYNELINILSKFYTVYAIDLPMHGKSEKPKKYLTIPDFSFILKEFISKLNLRNPVICGHSAGCLIAMEYASRHKTRGLILINPAGSDYYNYKILLFYKLLLKTLNNFKYNPAKSVKIIKVGLYNFFKNIFNKNFWALFDANFKRDYSNEMKKIKWQTKILWAKQDELFQLKYSKKFKQNIKNSEIIIVNGNHDWPILKPQEIMKYVNAKTI